MDQGSRGPHVVLWRAPRIGRASRTYRRPAWGRASRGRAGSSGSSRGSLRGEFVAARRAQVDAGGPPELRDKCRDASPSALLGRLSRTEIRISVRAGSRRSRLANHLEDAAHQRDVSAQSYRRRARRGAAARSDRADGTARLLPSCRRDIPRLASWPDAAPGGTTEPPRDFRFLAFESVWPAGHSHGLDHLPESRAAGTVPGGEGTDSYLQFGG